MTRGWLALSKERFSRVSRGTRRPSSLSRARWSCSCTAQWCSVQRVQCRALYAPRSILNCHQRDRLRAERAHISAAPAYSILFSVTTVLSVLPSRHHRHCTLAVERRRARLWGRLCNASWQPSQIARAAPRDRDFRMRSASQLPRKMRIFAILEWHPVLLSLIRLKINFWYQLFDQFHSNSFSTLLYYMNFVYLYMMTKVTVYSISISKLCFLI